MEVTCPQGATMPQLITEICNGKYTSTICTLHQNALPYFALPANTSTSVIINTLVSALQVQRQLIDTANSTIGAQAGIIADLTSRIEFLENNI